MIRSHDEYVVTVENKNTAMVVRIIRLRVDGFTQMDNKKTNKTCNRFYICDTNCLFNIMNVFEVTLGC